MPWNWTQPDWPRLHYDSTAIDPLERRFLLSSGEILGAVRHVTGEERDRLRIELLSEEAMRTSAIEGEVLDRSSVQSSLRRQFGLTAEGAPSKPREQGIAEMMVDVYSTYAAPLSHDTVCRWHGMLLSHDRGLETIGAYRRHDDAMQIVSGRIDRPTVHFEAPPSAQVQGEMDVFVNWFNRTAPDGPAPLPALTRAALGHLWFESIHPFEDGNGRLGRALAEKSLAQNIGQPRLNAQQVTLTRVAFFIAKAKFYDQFRDRLNDRQAKVVERMFREGPDGFKGGLSAENYIAITGTSRATTTRDLQDLVEMGALSRTGERRHTRYWLSFAAIA
jgi:Fic family protein